MTQENRSRAEKGLNRFVTGIILIMMSQVGTLFQFQTLLLSLINILGLFFCLLALCMLRPLNRHFSRAILFVAINIAVIIVLNAVMLLLLLLPVAMTLVGIVYVVATAGLSFLYVKQLCLGTAALLRECGADDVAVLGDQAIRMYLICTVISAICSVLSVLLLLGDIPGLASGAVSVFSSFILFAFLKRGSKSLAK